MKTIVRCGLAALALSLAPLAVAQSGALTESQLQQAAARVDAALTVALQAQRQARAVVAPIPAAVTPAAWLRRASLDLAGRLPTGAELAALSREESPEAFGRVVDRLLADPGANDRLSNRLAEALALPEPATTKSASARIFLNLKQAVADDLAYDQLVVHLLSGTREGEGGWLWQKQHGQPDALMNLACDFSSAFLGARLNCAQCHDHPFADFTQQNTLEFAACFAAPQDQALVYPKDYMYRNAKPGQAVMARSLPLAVNGEKSMELTSSQKLAAWATQQESARLAKVGALRLWDHLFGDLPSRGGYAEGNAEWMPRPALALQHCTVPAGRECWDSEDPRLEDKSAARVFVDALGAEFQRCGWRQKELLRILARTQAYRREAVARQSGSSLAAAPWVRRLQPQQSWAVMSHVKKNTQAVTEIPAPRTPLFVLGESQRVWPDESRPTITHELTRFMAGSAAVEAMAAGCAAGVRADKPEALVDRLFADTLGRAPAEKERETALAHLSQHPEGGAQDIAWALLNTSEFLFSY